MRRRKSSLDASSLISIVVPAFEQEKTIVKDVKNLQNALQTLGYAYEIIIVDDGSKDKTYARAMSIRSPHIKILHYIQNQGKGQAVRLGMLQAKGEIIGFIDAGMDIHPNGFAMLLNHMDWYNADIIVGSKLHPASKVTYPFSRKILSWGYRFLTRQLFGFQVRDTQVGIKFFRRNVVRKILPRLVVKQWAFDVEILAVAYRLGFKKIYEAPVEINFKNSTITTFNVWRTIAYMLWDTFAVFYRVKILRFYDKKQNKDIILHPSYTS